MKYLAGKPAKKHHSHRNADNDDERTEVRLEHNQHQTRGNQPAREHNLLHALQHFRLAREQAGQIQNDGKLEQFRRLDIDRSRVNPAGCPVNLPPQKQNQQQQKPREAEIPGHKLFPSVHADKRQADAHRNTDRDKQSLLADKRKLRTALRRRVRNRSGINHHQAEHGHQHRHPQKRCIEFLTAAGNRAVENLGKTNHEQTSVTEQTFQTTFWIYGSSENIENQKNVILKVSWQSNNSDSLKTVGFRRSLRPTLPFDTDKRSSENVFCFQTTLYKSFLQEIGCFLSNANPKPPAVFPPTAVSVPTARRG